MYMLRLVNLSLLTLVFSTSVFAIDYAKCSKMLNNGWWMNYEYGGIDQPLTKATKKHGSSKATAVTSTEGSTATLDPGYWSNVTTSEIQTSSTWGDCDLFALNNLNKGREKFFKIHEDELLAEIAIGEGEFLDTLASLSLCDDSSFNIFKKTLQVNMSSFINRKSDQSYNSIIDSYIGNTVSLRGKCHIYN